jgi:hypothetical protein
METARARTIEKNAFIVLSIRCCPFACVYPTVVADCAANRRFQFKKRRQLFIRSHDETLSVAAMRVSNPDRSPARIHAWNTAPTPTGLAEIVSDDFPVLHAARCPAILLRICRDARARFPAVIQRGMQQPFYSVPPTTVSVDTTNIRTHCEGILVRSL